jgi:hypothetical protein
MRTGKRKATDTDDKEMMSGAKSLCARKTENQELNQNYLEPNQKI